MAETHGTAVTAARTFAAVVAEKHGLQPPVDVLGLLEQFATIEHADIPGTCEALLIAREKVRPLVILASARKDGRRERFSAAHELGHILMPWQHGTTVCHTEPEFAFADDVTNAIESDANQFAAELLFPAAWLVPKLRDAPEGRTAEALYAASEVAAVSIQVAMLAAGRCLSGPGFIACTDLEGRVEHVARIDAAERLRSRAPSRSELFSAERYENGTATVESHTFGKRRLWIVQHPQNAEIAVSPVEASGAILNAILANVDPGEALAAKQTVNGIIGALNGSAEGRAAQNAGALLAAVRARFSDREELVRVTSHERFDEFLTARAIELMNRRKS